MATAPPPSRRAPRPHVTSHPEVLPWRRARSGGSWPRWRRTGAATGRSGRCPTAASWRGQRCPAPRGCPGGCWPPPPSSAPAAPPCASSTTWPCSGTAAATGWAPRSLRILFQLRRELSQHKCSTSPQRQQQLRAQVKAELLSILMDTADLSNAIHWLPPGFLWAGRFPPWLVGLLGTISSLIGIYQASRGANSEAA
ncbi:peroxisomal membrane protein 11C isoform X6 [Passer montanus]|uniref:peroxisomal membrane protein 11C isoform X6 n=1 Tax=Passer montanus TaxID=9160 RepID=UPI0019616253|nr:peroxisomal membrane protein 11C isoform X6 [Passer montanus]